MSDTKILFLGTGGVSDAVRLHMPSIELSKLGHPVKSVSVTEFQQTGKMKMLDQILDDSYSCVLFSRPTSVKLMRFLKEKNAEVIVDMDDDFHSIPIHHPGYRAVGAGNPQFIAAIEECVSIADGLTVTTEALRQRWKSFQENIKIIPNGWSKTDPFWGYKYESRYFNIGWGGTITHRIDFEIVLKTLIRVAREHPHVRICIAGDPEIYLRLRDVPEKQKVFIPMVQYADYTHSLAYFDLLLAPLEDNEFNRAKSDIKLVDACAMRMPFVASSVGEYSKWREGGILVSTEQEWLDAITVFIEKPSVYREYAQRGHQYVQGREMGMLVHKWKEIIS